MTIERSIGRAGCGPRAILAIGLAIAAAAAFAWLLEPLL